MAFLGIVFIVLSNAWKITLQKSGTEDTVISLNCDCYSSFLRDFAHAAERCGYSLCRFEKRTEDYQLCFFAEETPFSSQYIALSYADRLDRNIANLIDASIHGFLPHVDSAKQVRLTNLHCYNSCAENYERYKLAPEPPSTGLLTFTVWLSFEEKKLFMSRPVDGLCFGAIKSLQKQLIKIFDQFIEK